MREVAIVVAVMKSRMCQMWRKKDSVESKMKPTFVADRLGIIG